LELEDSEVVLDPKQEFATNIVWAPRIWSPLDFLLDCIAIPNEVGFPFYGSDEEGVREGDEGYGGDEEEKEEYYDEQYELHEDDQEVDKGGDEAYDQHHELQEGGGEYPGADKEEYSNDKEEYSNDKEEYSNDKEEYSNDKEEYSNEEDELEENDSEFLQTRGIFYKDYKEQSLFRLSRFIWNPGDPLFGLFRNESPVSVFLPRELVADEAQNVLLTFEEHPSRNLSKGWFIDHKPDEKQFEFLLNWHRRTHSSLSNGSFRSNTLFESYQYLSNLFLSNETLLDQMRKTLLRKRWLFPDENWIHGTGERFPIP